MRLRLHICHARRRKCFRLLLFSRQGSLRNDTTKTTTTNIVSRIRGHAEVEQNSIWCGNRQCASGKQLKTLRTRRWGRSDCAIASHSFCPSCSMPVRRMDSVVESRSQTLPKHAKLPNKARQLERWMERHADSWMLSCASYCSVWSGCRCGRSRSHICNSTAKALPSAALFSKTFEEYFESSGSRRLLTPSVRSAPADAIASEKAGFGWEWAQVPPVCSAIRCVINYCTPARQLKK